MRTMQDDDLLEKGRAYAQQLTLSSQCLSCGIHFTETFAWFREQEFNCPECGGPLDDTPIVRFAEQAIERLRRIQRGEPVEDTPEADT